MIDYIVYAGGGGNFPFFMGASSILEVSHKFKYKVGTSSGAMAALITSNLNSVSKAQDLIFVGLKEKDIFNKVPFYKNGLPTIKSLWRFLIKNNTLGEQENLKKLLKYCVTEEDWEVILESEVTIYIGCTNFNTGGVRYFNITSGNYTYDEVINIVNASCSIYPVVPPVKIRKDYFIDGGYIDHMGAEFLFKKHGNLIHDGYCVYSRPDKIPYIKNDFNNVKIGIKRLHKLLTYNISKEDERYAMREAARKNINVVNIYNDMQIPTYKINKKLYIDLYNHGIEKALTI